MKFIEVNGKKLTELVSDGKFGNHNLEEAGVENDSIIRINQHGDIEIRRPQRWDVIGGLLGDFEDRLKEKSGLDWV